MNAALNMQMLLQALGDANRLKMIRFIGADECSVSQIIGEVKLSQPLVSHHLRTLRENRILETTRRGPFVYYRLSNAALLDILAQLEEAMLANLVKSYQPLFVRITKR
jgi:DNA-binding transcriptional ArsR family regulator